MRIDHILYLLVDVGGLRQELVEREAADNIPHGRLTDLIYRVVDVLDRDDRLFRVADVIVSDSGNIDGNVVFGDDLPPMGSAS